MLINRRIGKDLEEYVPNLESLILTGNHIEELSDIEPLINLEKLSTLCLLQNPITSKQHYRLYLIYKLPQLTLLDFRKIKMKERQEAKTLFKSKKGKEIRKEITLRAKTFVPGGSGGNVSAAKLRGNNTLGWKINNNKWLNAGLNDEEVKKIREAINEARSLDEVEMLQKLLQAGQIPGAAGDTNGAAINFYYF